MENLGSDVVDLSRADSWQAILADSIVDPLELCRLLELDPSAVDLDASAQFPLLVPRTFIDRIEPGNAEDPLLVQVLPTGAELSSPPGFSTDPLGEASACTAPGLLQKYRGRSLIVTTGRCGVHCRYCFRRHFPYLGRVDWAPVILQIAAEPTVHEVILSGGDPLTLSDDELANLATQLEGIRHLKRLRIHTRLPVMTPQRVTGDLLKWLTGTRLTPIVVIQANHAAEIDDSVAEALGRLIDAGVPVLNQAVLLRGVNDDVKDLAGLFERLINIRVLPYYLHQLDPVGGAADFQVPETTGKELIEQLRQCLPGYAVPRYVRESSGGICKEILA